MAASNRSSSSIGAVHFTLMFFVMLSVVLGVMAFMMNKEFGEKVNELDAVTKREKTAKDAQRKLDSEVQALKAKSGYNQPDVGLDKEGDATTVLGKIPQDLKDYGPNDLPEQTLAAALKALRSQLVQIDKQHNIEKAAKEDLQSKYDALDKRYQAIVDQHRTARTAAETSHAEVVQNRDEAIRAKDQEIAQVRDKVNQVNAELEQVRQQAAADLREREAKIAQLDQIIKDLRLKFTEANQESFEVPDGVIRTVDHNTNLVWINLGSADNLPVRMTFSVYTKAHHGVARDSKDIKGKIEVTRIVGPHFAEARVLDQDIAQPIAPDDPIYTPAWSAGRKERFAVVGLVDMDGDGVSDRDRFRELIARASATLDVEVDDDGNRSGDGMSVQTKFLILGDIPDPTKTSKKEEQDKIARMQKHRRDLTDEALQHGVRIVNLTDFLSYAGEHAKNRLWIKGQDAPWRLKAGAASVGLNSPITDRQSAGTVSSIYTKRNPTQPVSSGQTSKLFSGPKK